MAEINAEIYKVDQSTVSTGQVPEAEPGEPPSGPTAFSAPPIQGRFDWRKALFPWSVIGPAFREECQAIAADKPMPRFLSPYARRPAAYPAVTLRGCPFRAEELALRRDIAAIVGEGRP